MSSRQLRRWTKWAPPSVRRAQRHSRPTWNADKQTTHLPSINKTKQNKIITKQQQNNHQASREPNAKLLDLKCCYTNNDTIVIMINDDIRHAMMCVKMMILMTLTRQRSKQQMVASVWMSSSGEKRVALPVATLVSRPLGMLLK